MYDVIVIGAGPSGCMCAITAANRGKKVLLIEKNEVIGKKMKLTGGGRCNITNFKENNEFIKNLPLKNGRFLYSSLNNFGPKNIYQYFENLEVPLKIEKDDKVFPVSNQSLDFINALKKELEKNKVTIKYNTEVTDIQILNDYKVIKTTSEKINGRNIVISTGGKTYPHTGSTGFGHDIAHKLNHNLTEIFPTESPIISHDEIINSKELQGLSFQDVKLSLVEQNKELMSHTNDLIITHFGLSGPCALKLSQFVYHYLKEHTEATLQLDVIPDKSYQNLVQYLRNERDTSKQKLFKTIVKDLAPNRYINYLFKSLNFSDDLTMSSISNKQIDDFVMKMKKFEIKVHEIKPIQVAFVTGGGVSLKEINPKTMESKQIKGLYFTGEVLDLHGYTGGYNMTIALSTGYTAGISID